MDMTKGRNLEALAIRREHAPVLAEVLTRAFAEDPLCSYLFPEPERRAQQMRWIFEREVRAAAHRGEAYTTPDLAGSAHWRSPEESTAHWFWAQARAGFWRIPFRLSPVELARGLKILTDVAAHMTRNIREPHWVLDSLGIAPERQGQGITGILLRPVLRRADEAGIPCYVMTNKEKNITLYEHFGFRVTDRYFLSNTDVLMCGLRRAPA